MVEPVLELAKANEIDAEEVVDLHLEWGGTDSASDHKSVMTEPQRFPVTPDQHEEGRPRGQDAGTLEGWFARQHALRIAQRLEGCLVVSARREEGRQPLEPRRPLCALILPRRGDGPVQMTDRDGQVAREPCVLGREREDSGAI